jgi:hypothetical protein
LEEPVQSGSGHYRVTVIGVTPRDFFGLQLGTRPDIWLPLALRRSMNRASRFDIGGIRLVARLKPDVSIEQARAEMAVLFQWTVEERVRDSTNDSKRSLGAPTQVRSGARRRRSLDRTARSVYEGDIMTAEALVTHNERKFISLFRSGNDWRDAAPTWLQGKYYIDLRGTPYLEERYQDLITTLHGTRPAAPPIRNPPRVNRPPVVPGAPSSETLQPPPEFVPIQILGVVIDEITQPRADGTRGSALYTVPFQLSRRPSSEWSQVFIEKWNHPSYFPT